MKKVLLASTALVLSAGIASAEVAVGGDGRMGVSSYDGADLGFTSRIRISFAASGETDGGLSFGGSVRADNSTGGTAGTAGSVFVEGGFGKITMGDVSGAAEAAVGDASGVGLTGLGDFNELTYLSNSDRSAMRYDYTSGDLSFHVSADNPAPAGDQAYGVSMTYGMGDMSFGLGYEDNGTASHIAARVTATFGAATVKAVYGSADDLGLADDDQYAVSIDYTTGATTITAFASKAFTGNDAYGVGVAYDLGGGASLKAGFADSDANADANYDFGLSMSF